MRDTPLVIYGIDVIEDPNLPIPPTPTEVTRRTVRHAMAAWVTYGGEAVGPAPHAATHVVMKAGRMVVSRVVMTALKDDAEARATYPVKPLS